MAVFKIKKPISPAIVLVGPTAIGKTSLSLEIASRFSGEIIGLDSMQVYRYMDIGTAKATPEERQQAPHRLIDFIDPDTDYNVARYCKDARDACEKILAHGNIPLFVGGTGLYLKGLLEGLFEESDHHPQSREQLKKKLNREGRQSLYAELLRVDPESAKRIHVNDTHRLLRALEIYHVSGKSWSSCLGRQNQEPVLDKALLIGLTCSREILYKRINERVEMMVERGLLDEVKGLLAMGYHEELKSVQSIGYRHMVNFLSGRWDWETSIRLLARDTRRYAKRQFTWFGRNKEIRWFHPGERQKILATVDEYLGGGS